MQKNSARILLHNTGGIGFITDERSKDTLNMERLKDLTIKYEVDLICLTEVNRDWRSIDKKIQFGMGHQVRKKIDASKFHRTPQKGQRVIVSLKEPQ